MAGASEVTVCDHFTFLGEVSELEFSPLLEPRKDDVSGLVKAEVQACSSAGSALPQ